MRGNLGLAPPLARTVSLLISTRLLRIAETLEASANAQQCVEQLKGGEILSQVGNWESEEAKRKEEEEAAERGASCSKPPTESKLVRVIRPAARRTSIKGFRAASAALAIDCSLQTS
ncbi:hypothetical protein V8C35DRAFT_302445 [Trichoderma chlorosporum]